MRLLHNKSAIVLSVLFAIAVGCNEQSTRFPVAGKVFIDGKELTTGSIQFVPTSGRPAASKIGRDGSFRLADMSVSEQQVKYGVLGGKYKIGVSSVEILSEDNDEVLQHIPKRYADFRKSELEVEISKPEEDMVIELTWVGAEQTQPSEEEAEIAQAPLEEEVSKTTVDQTDGGKE